LQAFFNDKAGKWKNGRKDIFANLTKAFLDNKSPVIWFHCASLGEFEQGRPVIEAFKLKYPKYKVLLTFFSPSGYEVRKNYAGADYVFYLPLDTRSNTKRFVQIVNPTIAVFVKYEFWYNYMNQLHDKGIPLYLISAKFRGDQYFFKWYGNWFRGQLNLYAKIFLQDVDSEELLNSIRVKNKQLAGDTRFDRVIAIAEQAKSDAIIESFKGNNKLWICGSTWEEDEKQILSVYKRLEEIGQKIKLLIVPHEIGEKHVKQVIEQFNAKKYSEVNSEQAKNLNVLVVDKMGMLSALYRYANVAYIGGGFGKNIHNLPEAAVFGLPVVFGPNYHKFTEAIDLIECKGGFTVSNSEELSDKMKNLFNDANYCQQCGRAAKAYIYNGSGATEKILTELEKVAKP